MEITGKVHCFFEQSGTFKNEFIKLGIPAEDYDIQNNFGETDNVIDLFAEIEKGYDEQPSIFDKIGGGGDLIMAFFPCVHFCDAFNIDSAHEREKFYILLLKLSGIVSKRKLRMIIENPWNTSRGTYLQQNFINPSLIDTNRSLRGDYFVKPTAYWYIGCNPTSGHSMQKNTDIKIVYKQRDKQFVKGQCSEQRSLISPDYARNFICDFILGKEQDNTIPTLF